MNVHKKYVVFELSPLMGSDTYNSLVRTQFKGWLQNSFDSEEEAVQALIDNEMEYQKYYILKEILIN